MKNVLNCDFAEILKGIKIGKVDKIYFIYKDEGADDVEFEEVTQSSIAAFAGTNINEVRTAMNIVTSEYKPRLYEFARFTALSLTICKEMTEALEEESDEESFICEYIEAHIDEADNAGTDDWNCITKCYEYPSMKGGILVKWRWETFVGCNPKLIRFEYCDTDLSTLLCKPVDKATAVQCSLLASPNDMRNFSCASELRDFILLEANSIGLGHVSFIMVDDFLRKLYHDAKLYSSLYMLPKNDIL